MKIPKPILDYLKTKGIKRPSPIQMQGLPTALVSIFTAMAISNDQIFRERYDWDRLYRFRQDIGFQSTSNHAGARNGGQASVSKRRRTGRLDHLPVPRIGTSNIRRMSGHVYRSQGKRGLPRTSFFALHRRYQYGRSSRRPQSWCPYRRRDPWSTDGYVG